MALERAARRSRGRVPEPDRLVPGCGRHQYTVRSVIIIKNLESVVQDRFHYSDLPVEIVHITSYAWSTTVAWLSQQYRSKADCKIS